MSRPSRIDVLMQMAVLISHRGTCDRKQVGAVISRDNRVIAVGYNGAPPGLPHCDENNHGYPDALIVNPEVPCRNATHAEANALAFAARYGVSTDEATLFVTVSPCLDCARLLIAAGISVVIFQEEYRLRLGMDLLEEAKVLCASMSSLRSEPWVPRTT